MAVLNDEELYRGVTCRSCGARPQHHCKGPNGRKMPCHTARVHDLIAGKPCECGRCNRKPKQLDTTPQN